MARVRIFTYLNVCNAVDPFYWDYRVICSLKMVCEVESLVHITIDLLPKQDTVCHQKVCTHFLNLFF